MRGFLIVILVGLIMCALPVEVSADVDAEATADTGAVAVPNLPDPAEASPGPATPADVPLAAAAEPEPTPSTWSALGWQLAGYVVPVLGSLLTVLVGFGIAWLKTKIANLKWQSVLDQLEDAVDTAVAAVQQTTVDALKRAGGGRSLTVDEKSAAFTAALGQVKAVLGTKGLSALQAALGVGKEALEAYLASKIEAQVGAQKVTP